MAKKLNLVSVLLSVVVVLGLVYFLRPQTFSFLKQGFNSDMLDPEEGYEEEEGFFACQDGEKLDSDGNCVSVNEGFFDCVNGVDENGEPC